jgi:hypothetical protein
MNRFERRIASLTFSLFDITETGVAMAEFSVIGARRLPDQSSSRTLVSLLATSDTEWPTFFATPLPRRQGMPRLTAVRPTPPRNIRTGRHHSQNRARPRHA